MRKPRRPRGQGKTGPTLAESAMWELIRLRRIDDAKFIRQARIMGYIADFCARSLKLVVEVDGPIHDPAADRKRDGVLERKGFRVVRFTNSQVLGDTWRTVLTLRLIVAEMREETLRRQDQNPDVRPPSLQRVRRMAGNPPTSTPKLGSIRAPRGLSTGGLGPLVPGAQLSADEHLGGEGETRGA
jgi:very-short-patch-repair endonuclease